MLNKYISILKAPQERTWRLKFNFRGSNRATGETPWAFNVSNLHKLFEKLEQGFNGDPYRLVVIDSLKAVMDLGGIDFGIGPMGTCMRLIQAAADRFNVTALWLHHTKPGAAKADMGIDGAGGNSNITQVPFAVHTLHKVQRKGHDHVVRWTVQKLRGEPSRTFEYTLDPDNGFFKLVHGDVEENRTTDILFQLWLKRSDGVSTTELVDCIDNAKKTIQNRLTALGKDKLIRSEKRRWHITSKGTEPLLLAIPELAPEVEEWKKGGG
ncbi:hypothetical protein MITS9509_00510 [Synechococcus sp. MIT S9509]|uniref:hypothetical protein n=1 Tax=unclassified Synechococcus TaxID=2626047 RepID=UPI0007BB53C8|nr:MULTISPECIES: hypothetical protein [unclassified Synechococcus]KZR87709.1 hypothetical protein MITS9504_00131 [Synechococcus sp. MIT S9504]KZR93217.1 hypothetical protein MITS9509_00510 [Synechococcus sp. MIT S9509]